MSHPDGSATASNPGAASPAAVRTVKVDEERVYSEAYSTSLAFGSNSKTLYGSSTNGTFRFGESAEQLGKAPRARHHLLVGPDGSLFVDSRKWKPGADQAVYSGPELPRGYEVTEGHHTPDGRYSVVLHNFRPPRGRPYRKPDGSKGYEYSRPNEPSVEREYAVVFDVQAREEKVRVPRGIDRFATSLRYVAARNPANVWLFDLESSTEHELIAKEQGGTPLARLAFGGAVLFAVDFDGRLYSWSLPDGKPLLSGGATREGRAETLAVRGDLVFVGFEDGTMALHSPDDGSKIHEWSRPSKSEDRRIVAAAFSPDGERLVTAHGLLGGDVVIWKLKR